MYSTATITDADGEGRAGSAENKWGSSAPSEEVHLLQLPEAECWPRWITAPTSKSVCFLIQLANGWHVNLPRSPLVAVRSGRKFDREAEAGRQLVMLQHGMRDTENQ